MHSELSCTLSEGDWQTQLKLVFAQADNARQRATKVAFINGKAFKSSAQYLRQRFGQFELGFHSVVFNPSDHDLVRGEPAIRRAYLDRILAAESIEYLDLYSRYQRLLDQRNAVLKESNAPQSRRILEGFTESFVQLSAEVTLKRLEWISRVQKDLNNTLHKIAPEQSDLRLIYLSQWIPEITGLCISNNNLEEVHFTGQSPPPSLDQLRQSFWKKLSVLQEAEWRSGHSLVGPHRDDWGLFLGPQMLKGHGSQGEVRSALLALKLCEVDQFKKVTGHQPLFLLDDFSSELDQHRREYLIRFLLEGDLQVFVSTTEVFAEELLRSAESKKFWINQGQATLK